MSEIKHTPGPWEWDDEVWAEYDPEQRAPWLIGSDGQQVLTGRIKCRTEADARLIAAAPDLLKTLTILVENIVHAMPSSALLAPVVNARAAIAKARGEA
jgi:hypothetical protein